MTNSGARRIFLVHCKAKPEEVSLSFEASIFVLCDARGINIIKA